MKTRIFLFVLIGIISLSSCRKDERIEEPDNYIGLADAVVLSAKIQAENEALQGGVLFGTKIIQPIYYNLRKASGFMGYPRPLNLDSAVYYLDRNIQLINGRSNEDLAVKQILRLNYYKWQSEYCIELINKIQ